MTNHQRKAELYRERNLEAAAIIAADPQGYPGLMQEWACLVLQRDAEQATPLGTRAA
jgi:hypothetical protein